jgi:hypothetical protein
VRRHRACVTHTAKPPMTKFVVRQLGENIDPDSFAAKPRTLYRAGETYARIAPTRFPSGPNGDTFLYPHTQIDAQGSYTLANGLQLIVSGLNLNNQVFGFYNGSEQWNIQREFYGRTVFFGLKLTR